EDDPDTAGEALVHAFFEAIGREPVAPRHRVAHRWRFARPAEPAGEVFWDPRRSLGAGGDWSYAARVEGAFLAGHALAGRLLGQLAADAESTDFTAGDAAHPGDGQLALELV
ncbi:MAG: hypothetical protein AAGM22_06030, partial [Acidobacteriota bacterium]